MNPIETAHPLSGFFDVFLGNAIDCRLGCYAPRVVSFVVDDNEVLRRGHVFEYLANIGLVAESSALVHGPALGDAFFRIPIEGMPIDDFDLALAKSIVKTSWDDVELSVEILV